MREGYRRSISKSAVMEKTGGQPAETVCAVDVSKRMENRNNAN